MNPLVSGRNRSLTASIVRVTVAVCALMVAIAFGITFYSTYRAATVSARERQLDYVRFVANQMDVRFSSSLATVRRAVLAAAQLDANTVSTRFLASQYLGASEVVDRLLLTDSGGHLSASYPTWAAPVPGDASAFAASLHPGESGYVWVRGAESDTPVLWVVQRFTVNDGSERVLMARARTGFVKSIVNQVASPSARRAVAITVGRSVLVSAAVGPRLPSRSNAYRVADPYATSELRVTSASAGSMRGFGTPLKSTSDLGWRVVVVEADAALFDAAMKASVPTMAVLIVGSFLAVFTAWFVSVQFLRPLRQLTATGIKAASGAYVAPLESGREDEVGRLAEAFNAVAVRLNALHDVSLLLSGASRTDQVLDAIVEATAHLAGPGATAVYLADDVGRLVLARATPGFEAPPGPIVPGRTGTFRAAWGSDSVARLTGEGLPGHWPDDVAASRVLVAPLVAGTDRMGVIVVLRRGPHDFSDAEEEMLRVFATQAAVAVSKAELFAREIDSRWAAEVLRDVASELVRPGELADALPAVRARIARGLEAREVLFAFEDREALGLPEATDPEFEELAATVAAAVVRPGLMSTTVRHGENDHADELMERLEADSLLVGRIAPGSGYGAEVIVSREGAPFGETEVKLLDGIAKTMTIALDNAFSSQRSRARATNLEKVFRISQAVGSSLRIKVVLNRVLDVVQMIFSADAVSLMIHDPDRKLISTSMARGAISSRILHLEVAPGQDVPGQVFAEGHPAMIDDVSTSSLPLAFAASEIGLSSLMAVPLLARGSSIGVLNVFAREVAAFDDEDLELLQTFASQAALAIDTARMYEREHDVAAVLQRSVLPEKPPSFDEIEVATIYEPAASDVEIGGDYYDLVRAPDGDVVFAVADVCGKGVEAATKTSMLKYSIRALVAAGLGPAECLYEINNMVVARGDTADILTVWIGFLDARAGVLRWSNGGHPPGLLMRASDREIVRLTTTGPLLGAMRDTVFEESLVGVSTGDIVLLYTDGVTEARSGNKFFGEGRVRRALRYGGAPDQTARNVLAAVSRFAQGERRDDIAIVAVRVV